MRLITPSGVVENLRNLGMLCKGDFIAVIRRTKERLDINILDYVVMMIM